MSDAIGDRRGRREQEIFLGREVTQRREISDRTAQLVDEEVKPSSPTPSGGDPHPHRAAPGASIGSRLRCSARDAGPGRGRAGGGGKTLPPQARALPLGGKTPTKEKTSADRARPRPVLGNRAAPTRGRVKVTALAAHTSNPRRCARPLAARGWEAQPAWFAATGIQALVVLIEAITEASAKPCCTGREERRRCVTGDGWAPSPRPRAGSRRWRATTGRRPRWRVSPPSWAVASPRTPSPPRLGIRGAELPLDKPLVSGIVNVTPDSFSDGGASRRQTRPSPTLNG